MKTPLANQHQIISSRRNFVKQNIPEGTQILNQTSVANNKIPSAQFVSPILNSSTKIRSINRDNSGNTNFNTTSDKIKTSNRKLVPTAVSYVDMSAAMQNIHFQRNFHHRAPTPQALRPLSTSGNRKTIDKNSGIANNTIPLENLNQINRPQTSNIISNSKKYQTTRLIVNDNINIIQENQVNQLKPPKPRNSAKGLAMTKLQTIKRIVSAAMKENDLSIPNIANQRQNLDIGFNTTSNKENMNSNIKKDHLMKETEKVFQDFVKQNFQAEEKLNKKKQTDQERVLQNQVQNVKNVVLSPKNDVNKTLSQKRLSNTGSSGNIIQDKEEKVISRGMKLERALKQNNTYDSNNCNRPPIQRTQSQVNVNQTSQKPNDLTVNNILRQSSENHANEPLLQKFLQKRSSIHDYELGQKLGEGAYAIVRQCRHKQTNNKIAMKIYDKIRLNDPVKKRSVSREISLLQRLDHPNIVKFYESIDTNKTINLVMEHVKGKSLYSFLKAKKYRRVDEREAKQIFKQVVEGVNYLHKQNIAHRDLKPDNILIEDSISQASSDIRVKLIDFGFSINMQGDKKLRTFCGTPSFMSPEIVSKKDYCGKQSDVWALGVILYSMIFGRTPFRAENERELYRKIAKGSFYFPDEVYKNQEEFRDLRVSNSAKNFIKKILVVNGDQRLNCEEILKDEWFKTS